MATVHIGLGSNLGDREANCREALTRLEQAGCRIVSCSNLIETQPWGLSDQPLFMNAAATILTDRSPRDLLTLLKFIERDMGRIPSAHWGPRKIDLDILLYDDLILDEPDLVIPHPRLHERDFVLTPLAEIAPDAVHPSCNATIRELKERV